MIHTVGSRSKNEGTAPVSHAQVRPLGTVPKGHSAQGAITVSDFAPWSWANCAAVYGRETHFFCE